MKHIIEIEVEISKEEHAEIYKIIMENTEFNGIVNGKKIIGHMKKISGPCFCCAQKTEYPPAVKKSGYPVTKHDLEPLFRAARIVMEQPRSNFTFG